MKTIEEMMEPFILRDHPMHGETVTSVRAEMIAEEFARQKIQAIRKKITDRMDMFPDVDDPSLRDRGAIDAYTNALEWIDELNK